MPQHTYVDFDLLIERGDEGYRARVLNSPVGETRPVPVTLPFSDLELENFLLRVGRPRRQTTRGEGTPEAAAVRDFGGRLFDAIFTDRVRTALTSSLDQVEGREDTGLRVRLRLADSPELADLPWEYLYDRDARRFLALSPWTPVVRYLELPRRIRPLTVQPPLRILMAAASPTDFPRLDVVEEWEKVRDALADLQETGRVQLDRVPTGRLADLRSSLRRGEYHVFHFIGHGRYDPVAQDGVLALEGPGGRAQLLSGADLGALLSDHRSLRLAVLNSCEGARGGRADPYSGTAQSLVHQGIPAVVAMQFEITDDAAITFAHSLYEAVADGYQLDAAMAEARNAVRDEPNPVEWGTPVLYLRAPDGRIFDLPPRTAPPDTSGQAGAAGPARLERPAVLTPRRDDAGARPPRDPVPTPPPAPGARPDREPAGDPRPVPRPGREAESSGPPPGPGLPTTSSRVVPPTPTPAPTCRPTPTSTPTLTPTPPAGRRRLQEAAVGLLVLAGAGIGGYLLLRGDDPLAANEPAPSTSAPAPTSEPLLPQGPPLPDTTLVVPRTVGDDADLYLMDAGGAVAQRLTTAPGADVGPLISADRSTIVYQHAFAPGQYELRAMGTDGSGDRLLPVEGCPSPDRPAWNPADSTQLAVACTIEGRTDLRIVTVDGTTVRDDLDPGVAYLSDLTFSADGTRVVYWGTDTPADGDGHLYSLPVDGSGGATRLTDVGGNADPVFSPDGTQIAFRREAGGESRIYVMADDGSAEQPVTSRDGVDQDPTWSPDGQSIAFKSNRPGDHPGDQVWVVDRSGDGLRQLGAPDGVAVNAPAWSNR